VAGSRSEARPIARRSADHPPQALAASDPSVLAAALDDHLATLAHIRQPVGRTALPLTSFFALVTDAPAVQIVADAQAWHVTRHLRGTPHRHLPVLSAAAPFKAGGRGGPDYYTDVPAGDISLRSLADLYLYPNSIRVLRITGAQLKDWLERSASVFNRIRPDRADQMLLSMDHPTSNFDVIYGVTYRIDLAQPARYDPHGMQVAPDASRITALSFNGQPVTAGMEFAIATNSYRAAGGANFPGLTEVRPILESQDQNRDILRDFIAQQDAIRPTTTTTWSFVPMPGASVLFDTSPRAAGSSPPPAGLAIEPVGLTPDGFLRYRLRL